MLLIREQQQSLNRIFIIVIARVTVPVCFIHSYPVYSLLHPFLTIDLNIPIIKEYKNSFISMTLGEQTKFEGIQRPRWSIHHQNFILNHVVLLRKLICFRYSPLVKSLINETVSAWFAMGIICVNTSRTDCKSVPYTKSRLQWTINSNVWLNVRSREPTTSHHEINTT